MLPKSRKRLPRLVRDLVLGVMGKLDLQVIFPAPDLWVLFPVPNLWVLFLTLDLLGTSLFPLINLLLYLNICTYDLNYLSHHILVNRTYCPVVDWSSTSLTKIVNEKSYC